MSGRGKVLIGSCTVSYTHLDVYKRQAEWNAESGYPNLFLNGTDHYSTSGEGSEGQYYTMKFIGTGIEIYASKNTAHADFDVYIDDEFAGTGEANLESRCV